MYCKKLYTLFICITSIIFFSCEEDLTKKYQDNALLLEKEVAAKQLTINMLTDSTKIYKKKVDSLETIYKNEFENIDYVSTLIKHQNLFVDKEKLITSIISILNIEQQDIMPQLFETFMFYKSYEEDSPYHNLIPDKLSAINALWDNADRSPEAIKAFLTEKDKDLIINLFKNNSIYKDAGLYAIAKALITAYDEIDSDKQSQQDILELKLYLYKTQLSPDLSTDEYVKYIEKQEELIQNLSSEVVSDILSIENYSAYPETQSFIDNRLFLVYSFWARRNKEGNSKVVYNLIKEMHSKITNENFEEEIAEPAILDDIYEN